MSMPSPGRSPRPLPLNPLIREALPAAVLPHSLAPFVGRRRELAQLRALLDDPAVRLLTLTGPGGVGKTRLAVEAVATGMERLAGPVQFVSLAPITDPDLVALAIAQVLNVGDAGHLPLIDNLRLALRERPAVLLLDNLEQVLTAGPLISDLLAACPGLRILATSRAALHLYGERIYPVPPLGLPADGRDTVPSTPVLPDIAASDAVRLFVARAETVMPDFALTPITAPIVAAICRRLDGLPLAIELAAARTHVLPPGALLERLERPLEVLVNGPRDAPARHRTLHDTVAWSYGLLDDDQQAFFRRMAVFRGGFTLGAAEAVAPDSQHTVADGPGPGSAPSALDLVSSLVDVNLLRRQTTEDGEPRFLMLETVRAFAQEFLHAAGEAGETHDAHASWCLAFALNAEPYLLHGPGMLAWLSRVDAELLNLRTALAWCEAQGNRETWLRLAIALGRYWVLRSYLNEGRTWIERALGHGDDLPVALRARGLAALGQVAMFQRDPGVTRVFGEALQIAEGIGDLACQLTVRVGQTFHALIHGDIDLAKRRAGESVALSDALAWQSGAPGSPTMRVMQAYVTAYGGVGLDGVRRVLLGYLAQADGAVEESTSGMAYRGLGVAAWWEGANADALAWFQQALAEYVRIGEQRQVAGVMEDIAVVVSAARPEATVQLCGSASRLNAMLGVTPAGKRPYPTDRALAAAASRLGKAAHDAAWAAGFALAPTEAVTVALALTPHDATGSGIAPLAVPDEPPALAAAPPVSTGLPSGQTLTRRELEVLRLLVEGGTDREIGTALGISYRTATSYVASILTKLDAPSRTAAATYAIRQRLL